MDKVNSKNQKDPYFSLFLYKPTSLFFNFWALNFKGQTNISLSLSLSLQNCEYWSKGEHFLLKSCTIAWKFEVGLCCFSVLRVSCGFFLPWTFCIPATFDSKRLLFDPKGELWSGFSLFHSISPQKGLGF